MIRSLGRSAVWPSLLAITLLAGCAPFQDDRPPPREYLLEAPTDNPGALEARYWPQPLALVRPAVPPGLDGTQIRIRRPGQQLDHLADVRWAAPLPELLQDALHGALAGQIDDATVLANSAAEAAAANQLRVRITDFHPVYQHARAGDPAETPPTVEVALVLHLVDQRTGDTLATAAAHRQTDVPENRVTTIVAALDRTLAGAFAEALQGMAEQLGQP